MKLETLFYQRNVHAVAKELLGKIFVRKINSHTLSGKIVEVEAYDGSIDAAAHSFNGKTKRNDVMFKGGGLLYVYFTYGMHFCANVVTGKMNDGNAILIRALEPIEGIEVMAKNRFNPPSRSASADEKIGYNPPAGRSGSPPPRLPKQSGMQVAVEQGLGLAPRFIPLIKKSIGDRELINLTNGPAKICRALSIGRSENGTSLESENIFILDAPVIPKSKIAISKRIGIKKSVELPWRYFIKDNPFVSKSVSTREIK